MPRFLRHRPLALLPVIHSSHACENFVLLNNWFCFNFKCAQNYCQIKFSFLSPPAAYRSLLCVMSPCDEPNATESRPGCRRRWCGWTVSVSVLFGPYYLRLHCCGIVPIDREDSTARSVLLYLPLPWLLRDVMYLDSADGLCRYLDCTISALFA